MASNDNHKTSYNVAWIRNIYRRNFSYLLDKNLSKNRTNVPEHLSNIFTCITIISQFAYIKTVLIILPIWRFLFFFQKRPINTELLYCLHKHRRMSDLRKLKQNIIRLFPLLHGIANSFYPTFHLIYLLYFFLNIGILNKKGRMRGRDRENLITHVFILLRRMWFFWLL